MVRPSEFLAIDNLLDAYWFDVAVYSFGVAFQQDIEEATKSKGKKPDSAEMTARKREQRLLKWLEDSDAPKRFRDPNLRG